MTSREPPGDPKELILGALDQPLGGDLLQVVIYGSSVTGDILPGLSDLDVVIRTARPLDLKAAGLVHDRVRLVDLTSYAYAQATFVGANEPGPRLVPGAFEVLRGGGDVQLHTAVSLLDSGRSWLQQLSGELLQNDLGDWAFAGRSNEARVLRLLVTRLKPAVRAVISDMGHDPLEVWGAPWPTLVVLLRQAHPGFGVALGEILGVLRLGEDERWSAGPLILDLLTSLSVLDAS